MRRLALPMLICLAAVGCQSELDTYYGRRNGIMGGSSINGTAVLAKMFAGAGHDVSTWSRLSPRLERADTIVWFPNEFAPPSDEVREWLDDWLYREDGRTLIYVERDFDAEPGYWSRITPLAPKSQQKEVRSRLQQARTSANTERQAAAKNVTCEWYTIDRTKPPRKVASLDGPWAKGVDAKKSEIAVNSIIAPNDYAETLLSSQGDVLVSREYFDGDESSKLILVANGSFLLNLPLVNHEHRKLAGKLIDEVGPTGNVVFLESGPGNVPIHESDPDPEAPTGLELFAKWPLNWILFQLGLWGLIFAAARWPIFGRPKREQTESLTDFGRHVTALGELLERTGDRGYALAKIRHYQAAVLGETAAERSPASLLPASVEPKEVIGEDDAAETSELSEKENA
ncbi:MAG: hypothetical protein KDA42_12790 [Planctomycetales bacterium]|nr:hypothetical protein [Planctomycetales bacterium]